MKIKYIFLSAIVLIALALLSQSCEGMKDNFQEHVGERNYSARIDSLTATPGFNRVVLRWQNPTDQRSQGIKIVYGDDNREIRFDTLVDSASIEGLTTPVGRQFTVFTFDRFGNLSIPTSIVSFPVTQSFTDNLAPPIAMIRPAGAGHAVSFAGTTNPLMQFAGYVEYTITIPDGTVVTGKAELPELIGAPTVSIRVADMGIGMNYFLPGIHHIEYRVAVFPIMAGGVTEDITWLENSATVNIAPLPDRVNLMQMPGEIWDNCPWTTLGRPAYGDGNRWHWTSAENALALLDGNTNTRYQVRGDRLRYTYRLVRDFPNVDRSISTPRHIAITWRLETAFAVTEYTLQTMHTYAGGERDPIDWILEGSNDNEEWTLLHEVVDRPIRPRSYTETFRLNNSYEFLYHRITVTRTPRTYRYIPPHRGYVHSYRVDSALGFSGWTLWFDRADFWANFEANQGN